MSDFNLDMALAEQLVESVLDAPRGDTVRRSPLADCLNRARSVPGRSDKVLAVRSAKLKLERAAEEERAAVRELLADVSASELLAILAPSAVRSIVSALTGTK
jgi:hypothetical protein